MWGAELIVHGRAIISSYRGSAITVTQREIVNGEYALPWTCVATGHYKTKLT